MGRRQEGKDEHSRLREQKVQRSKGEGQPGQDEGLKEKQERQRIENETVTLDVSVLKAMRSH